MGRRGLTTATAIGGKNPEEEMQVGGQDVPQSRNQRAARSIFSCAHVQVKQTRWSIAGWADTRSFRLHLVNKDGGIDERLHHGVDLAGWHIPLELPCNLGMGGQLNKTPTRNPQALGIAGMQGDRHRGRVSRYTARPNLPPLNPWSLCPCSRSPPAFPKARRLVSSANLISVPEELNGRLDR